MTLGPRGRPNQDTWVIPNYVHGFEPSFYQYAVYLDDLWLDK